MSTPAEQLGKFEPHVQNLFHIFFDEVGGAPLAGREQFEIAIESAALPNDSNEEIELPVGTQVLYYAGRLKPENMAVVCRDFVDSSTYAFIETWRSKVHNKTTARTGFKSEYAGTARIQLNGPDGVIREWKLTGIWPQALNRGAADMTSNDIIKLDVTFRYDLAIPTIF